jgi:dihydrofolate reductase
MIKIIAAISNNGIIGANGHIPWFCPTDLKYFSKMTRNNIVLMGRKTFQSIGRPLPSRHNIVISREANHNRTIDGIEWCNNVDLAINTAASANLSSQDLFVIGGAEIYKKLEPIADMLYITRVLADVDGDIFFPNINWDKWYPEDAMPPIIQGPNDQYPMQFFTYKRR